MCVPPPLLGAVIGGIQAGTSVAQGFYQSAQQKNAARAAANEARAVRERALRAEEAKRREARAALGDLTARQSAGGIRADMGTPVTAAADLARGLEFDILRRRTAAEADAVQLENEARARRSQARFLKARTVAGVLPGLLRSTAPLFSDGGGSITVPRSPLA